MMTALRNKEMKLVMMNESKVCDVVKHMYRFSLGQKGAYASTCDPRISLHMIRNDRAVAWGVEHGGCKYRKDGFKERPQVDREWKERCGHRRAKDNQRQSKNERK